MLIQSKDLYDRVQQILCSPNVQQIMKAIVSIQRRWRVKHQSKFRSYRLLTKNHELKKKQWHITVNKYKTTRNSESELLNQTIHFEREAQNLEHYFWRQQVGYLQELEVKNSIVTKEALKEFCMRTSLVLIRQENTFFVPSHSVCIIINYCIIW